VSSEFGLRPPAVEDALKAHRRPKPDVCTDSLFLVLKPVLYDDSMNFGGSQANSGAAAAGPPSAFRRSGIRRLTIRRQPPSRS
jgi:Mg2+ and Co2+ transporter CorA